MKISIQPILFISMLVAQEGHTRGWPGERGAPFHPPRDLYPRQLVPIERVSLPPALSHLALDESSQVRVAEAFARIDPQNYDAFADLSLYCYTHVDRHLWPGLVTKIARSEWDNYGDFQYFSSGFLALTDISHHRVALLEGLCEIGPIKAPWLIPLTLDLFSSVSGGDYETYELCFSAISFLQAPADSSRRISQILKELSEMNNEEGTLGMLYDLLDIHVRIPLMSTA